MRAVSGNRTWASSPPPPPPPLPRVLAVAIFASVAAVALSAVVLSPVSFVATPPMSGFRKYETLVQALPSLAF